MFSLVRKFETFSILAVIFMAAFIFQPIPVFAHPGRTDSSGCHTCRTNCSSWGLSTGEYHCHNAKSLPQPKEPVKSHYEDSGTGYTEPAPEYKKANTINNNTSQTTTRKDDKKNITKIKTEIKKVEEKYYKNPDGFREKLTQQISNYLNVSENIVGTQVYALLPNIYNSSESDTIYKIRKEVGNSEENYYKNPNGFREKLTQQIASYLGISEEMVGEHVYSMLPNQQ